MFVGVLAGVFALLIGLLNVLPMVLRTLFRTDTLPGEIVHTRTTAAQPVRAFGYGLIVAGVGVVVIAHTVVYAREGIAGLEKALDPFLLGNYVSAAAVVPGLLTLWLARHLNARRRTRALYPTAQQFSGSEETAVGRDIAA
jgi:hypothetical protein